MKKIVVLTLFIVIIGGAAVVTMSLRLQQPFRAYPGSEQFVDIPQRSGSRTIGERLVASGVVQDHLTFRIALWRSGKGRQLKAGEYRFDRAMTPAEVVDKIARGDVYTVAATFPEGLTIAEMAKIYEAHGLGTAQAFVDASRDVTAINDIDSKATDLEGYLFPETYALPRSADAAALVRLMVAGFRRVLTPEIRDAAKARNLSVRQLVTLASIVEKETARADERPLVAAVYQTRLRIGMPLQCDPTVIFALTRAGRYDGNLHHDDLSFDSPYNTYRYAGLPPGPIASPGRASIQAVAHPADADYLYFVSRNDGSHAFAKTLDEHSRNVQKYQVQYFRERRR